MPIRYIFDLDDTVLCAKHRGAFRQSEYTAERLANWVKLSTPENISQDRTLPLARLWRKVWNRGATVTVCTSRKMSVADFELLRSHGLRWHEMLYRTSDAECAPSMKLRLLNTLPGGWDVVCNESVMFDDDPSVIEYLSGHGLCVHDAVIWNQFYANKV